jgi:hypothetical protein
MQDDPERRLTCPKCGSTDVRRSRSAGVVAFLFAVFGRWPFRCRSCRTRFFRYATRPAE